MREPRRCFKGCGREYVPTSNSQVWCPACRAAKLNVRHHNKRHSSAQRGRRCRWCGRSDGETVFRIADECCGCNSNAQHNGRCEDCDGRPKRRRRGGPAFCPRCEPFTPPAHYIRVELVRRGVTKVIHRHPEATVVIDGEPRRLKLLAKQLGQPVVLLVSKRHLALEQMRNPKAVAGLSEGVPLWQFKLHNLSSQFLMDIVDLAHYVRIREAHPHIEFSWWWSKFYPESSETAALRTWERVKSRLRSVGVPFEVVAPEPQPGAPCRVWPIHIDGRELGQIAELAVKILDVRRGKKIA